MIALPKGCTVTHAIRLDIDGFTDEMLEWFEYAGFESMQKTYYNYRGKEVVAPYVRFGKGKWCHYLVDGTGNVRLHFMGEDATTASMFVIKFNEHIIKHNFPEMFEEQ
jgi:hypothetical protein